MPKMKKSLIAAVTAISLTLVSAQSVNAESFSWYFKPAKDHAQPEVIPEAKSFADNYNTIYMGDPETKKVYLTFDAGYENGNVEKILDVLKEKNVKGAFFLLPNIIKNNTELVIRMKNEGHLICNHTKSHKDMSKITDYAEFESELKGVEDVLYEKTGFEADKFYRPPEGRFSEENLKFASDMGYHTVFWSLAYADWDNSKQMNEERALELVLARTHNGCVALFHPTSSTNANILGRYIDTLKEQGYEFGTLYDFVKDNKETQAHVYASNRDAGKYVALTFDDGPHPVYTEKILEILRNNNAKATFFVIGENAESYPSLVLAEYEDGHEIGNHTYSHPDMKKLSTESVIEEIEKTQDIIYDITGKQPEIFRSPCGVYSDELVEAIENVGCKPILWSWRQDTKDWTLPSVKSIVKTVTENIQDGDIILFHDYNKKGSPTPDALELILPKLAEKGYSFITVSELLKIKRGSKNETAA